MTLLISLHTYRKYSTLSMRMRGPKSHAVVNPLLSTSIDFQWTTLVSYTELSAACFVEWPMIRIANVIPCGHLMSTVYLNGYLLMVRFQTFLMCQFCKTHCQNKKLKQRGHTLSVVLPISVSSMQSSWIHLLQQYSSHFCPVPISSSGLYWCFHPCNVWLSFVLSKLYAGSRLSLESYSLLCLPLLLLCFLGLCCFFFSQGLKLWG